MDPFDLSVCGLVEQNKKYKLLHNYWCAGK